MGYRVRPLVAALRCQPEPCPAAVGCAGSAHTAWWSWVPGSGDFIPAGLHVWQRMHA